MTEATASVVIVGGDAETAGPRAIGNAGGGIIASQEGIGGLQIGGGHKVIPTSLLGNPPIPTPTTDDAPLVMGPRRGRKANGSPAG